MAGMWHRPTLPQVVPEHRFPSCASTSCSRKYALKPDDKTATPPAPSFPAPERLGLPRILVNNPAHLTFVVTGGYGVCHATNLRRCPFLAQRRPNDRSLI